jgi:hypothetical protein
MLRTPALGRPTGPDGLPMDGLPSRTPSAEQRDMLTCNASSPRGNVTEEDRARLKAGILRANPHAGETLAERTNSVPPRPTRRNQGGDARAEGIVEAAHEKIA